MACLASHYLNQRWLDYRSIYASLGPNEITVETVKYSFSILFYTILCVAYWTHIGPFWSFITLRPRQNRRHFADDTFKRIFVDENVRISIKFSLKFVPRGPIENTAALVQIMAWRRPGDKPLCEPMMVDLLTHICVTQPQ